MYIIYVSDIPPGLLTACLDKPYFAWFPKLRPVAGDMDHAR